MTAAYIVGIQADSARLGKNYENCYRCGTKVVYNGPYGKEIPRVLCDECSHCDVCKRFTENKKNGLCGNCRSLLSQRAKEVFFAAIDGVSINKQGRNSIDFTIFLEKDIDSHIRVLEHVDISEKKESSRWTFFKRKKVSFNDEACESETEQNQSTTQPFEVLVTMLRTTRIRSNTVKIDVNLTFKQRFGTMLTGGNYDYKQGIDEGYIVHVVAENDDLCTIPIVGKVLREELKFGCHVSNRTIDGFMPSQNPTSEGEEKIMKDVATKVLAAFEPKD